MKLNQVLQSIFLSLILVGLFATMAQNSYGFTLIGTACMGLALLFIAQSSWKLFEDRSHVEGREIFGISELVLLAVLLLLFGMRTFYIRPPYVDVFFILICLLLMVTYFFIASGIYSDAKKENPALARYVVFFYLSILLFLSSLGIRIISPSWSAVAGGIGALISIPFLLALIRYRKYDYSGKSITLLQFIVAEKNKAGLLFLFFIFSGIYVGLSSFKIIPTIENTDKPRTYIELINSAETGKDQQVNGKFRHEIYKEVMDNFLKRNTGKLE
jgi:hypothetical protein